MSAIKDTQDIVNQMKGSWINSTMGSFHFGNPQEVDNIHNKTLPLLVMNTPQITIQTKAWNSNTISCDSSWTFVVYNNIPSTYNVTNDITILGLWDTMENQTLFWFYDWWYYFENSYGVEFIMTSPIQITRLKESSNDRLLGLKVTFGFNFYRYCKEINTNPS